MKYIVSAKKSEPGIFFGRYLDYLKTIRSSLTQRIYNFASSQKYFELDSPHSLHDAHIQSLEVLEKGSKVEITLKLLGQCKDRNIILNYKDVVSYEILGQKGKFHYADTFHGDVFTHEIRLGKYGNLIHEILCVSDSTFLIECKNFTHREELLEPPN